MAGMIDLLTWVQTLRRTVHSRTTVDARFIAFSGISFKWSKASNWLHSTLKRRPRWKTLYIRNPCTVFQRETLFNVDDSDLERIHAAFATDHRKKVTWRNRLLGLHHTFGAAVLLDPVWNSTTLGKGLPAFSAVFPSANELIRTREPASNIITKLQEGNEQMLRALLTIIRSDS